jgi:hypothetical protein
MTAEPAQTVESAGRHRPVVLGVLRSLATIIVLVGLYYLLAAGSSGERSK